MNSNLTPSGSGAAETRAAKPCARNSGESCAGADGVEYAHIAHIGHGHETEAGRTRPAPALDVAAGDEAEPAKLSYVASRIWKHYNHAKKKHPYFCDRLIPSKEEDYSCDLGKEIAANLEEIAANLDWIRKRIKTSTAAHRLEWDELLNEEVWEVHEAVHSGDYAHAVEECFDAIAVLLRTIDVLEGRQKLGKADEKERSGK